MKKTSILLALLVSSQTFAQEVQFRVLERKAKTNGTLFRNVTIQDLISSSAFDGKYFKVVKGKSNDAISFKDDTDLVLKAATVYHHLTKARNFWTEQIDLHAAQKLPKIVVRLEITNVFNELGHFAHDKKDPQYNNALSVPGGKTPDFVPVENQDEWNKEIWFRPMKKIETKTLASQGPNPLTASLQAAEQPFLNYTQNQFAQTMLEHLFYPTYVTRPVWFEFVRYAGTIAMTKAVIEASKHMDNLFAEKYYYLDTAMVPEVIYHEFAHLVLSDKLEMTHSTPVIEGMADYFAAVQTDKRRIYARVRGFSNAASKDTEARRKMYSHWYEANRNATSDFVLSVLWDVRETLGNEIGNRVIFTSREFMKTNSATINHHLIQAILDACKLHCPSPRSDQLKLYEAFSQKGF